MKKKKKVCRVSENLNRHRCDNQKSALSKKKWLITAGDVKDISEMYTRFFKVLFRNTFHQFSEPAGCQTDESDNPSKRIIQDEILTDI